ncbi:unnamed protein product [Pedinophyceae sp. YPF-701]|nr:unnamed protein product [Pedinophyceae sp. YPF-701]
MGDVSLDQRRRRKPAAKTDAPDAIVPDVDAGSGDAGPAGRQEPNAAPGKLARNDRQRKATNGIWILRIPRAEKDNAKLDHLQAKFSGLLDTVKVLNESLRLKRVVLKERQELVNEEMTRFRAAQGEYKAKADEIMPLKERLEGHDKEAREIREALREIDCRSEEELDARIESYEQKIAHETMPLAQEKELIKQIKKLKAQRSIIVELAQRQAELTVGKSEREELSAQIRDMRGELAILKGDKDIVNVAVKSVMAERDQIREEIKKIEAEREVLVAQKDAVYAERSALRDEYRARDAKFIERIKLKDAAAELVAGGKAPEARERVSTFVEKYCTLYCTDPAFRKEYLSLTERSRRRRNAGAGEDEDPAPKGKKGAMKDMIAQAQKEKEEGPQLSPRSRAQQIIDQAMSEAQAQIAAQNRMPPPAEPEPEPEDSEEVEEVAAPPPRANQGVVGADGLAKPRARKAAAPSSTTTAEVEVPVVPDFDLEMPNLPAKEATPKKPTKREIREREIRMAKEAAERKAKIAENREKKKQRQARRQEESDTERTRLRIMQELMDTTEAETSGAENTGADTADEAAPPAATPQVPAPTEAAMMQPAKHPRRRRTKPAKGVKATMAVAQKIVPSSLTTPIAVAIGTFGVMMLVIVALMVFPTTAV